MSKRIVPDSPDPGNSPSDLICPVAGCRALCSFSSARFQVYCPTCGWRHDLTYTQHAELVDALLGISDLVIANFLVNLHVPDPPPPPSAGGFPATCGAGTRLIGGPRAGRHTGHRALVGIYTDRTAHKAPVQQALEGAAAIEPPAPPPPPAARPPGPPVGRKARAGLRRNPGPPPQPSNA